jgi:hypothetical protein
VHFPSFTPTAIWCIISNGCEASRSGKEKYINIVSTTSIHTDKWLSQRFHRYYGISAGIATLALAYGSVPMYKMVWSDKEILLILSF